jgi:periplasmic glucans biosynthesis protein
MGGEDSVRRSDADAPEGVSWTHAPSRRHVVAGGALAPVLAALFGGPLGELLASAAAAQDGQNAGTRFDAFTVRQLARELAAKPYEAPDKNLPAELDRLSYDDYRNIRFNPEQSVWLNEGLRFQLQLFSRGFLYRERVEINLVAGGTAQRIQYRPDLFRFDNGVPAPDPKLDLGFSGFRLHTPLNRENYLDEVTVFQGASYFRAVAKGQAYGVSARGLSLRTGHPGGEEFPFFREFWIEKPAPGSDSIVVYALLDSPSTTAAFRFTIRPGDVTGMAVEMTLYPRVDLDSIGLGTLTSMFLFAPNDRGNFDDFRPAVHDSDGLAMINGRGEHLWRPVTNPRDLQISTFVDTNPRGFGLSQRQRAFFDYDDLEARYERRPSIWVEPIGDWGEGAVVLLEIPTTEEIHDNIVAFWRPKAVMRQGGEYSFTYRMSWAWDEPDRGALPRFGRTRTGGTDERRLFVVDIFGPNVPNLDPNTLRANVTANYGKIHHLVLRPNPEIQGLRLSFVLEPEGNPVVELRGTLTQNDVPASEVWVYRWTQ